MSDESTSQTMAERRRTAFHALRVSDVRRLTDRSVCVSFDVPDELHDAYDFAPGQYVTIRATVQGQRMMRRYSICSPARSGTLQIGVKRRAEGRFSAYVTERLRAGDTVDVMTPMGAFVVDLDPRRERHVAAVAVGSGITPIRSIVMSLLAHEPRSTVTLVYANRSWRTAMFLDDLADLGRTHPDRFHVIHLLSDEPPDGGHLTGRMDPDRLSEIVAARRLTTTADLWYLCGPYGLVDALGSRLLSLGVDPAAVSGESFLKEGAAAGAVPRRQP